MDKNIKIHLQYPWKFPDSPYYKYMIDSPPKKIEFLNTGNQKGVITNKNFFWFSNFLKRNIRKWTNKLNLAIPNAHLSKKGNYDLIHCAHCLSKNNDKPWVADIEMISSFSISGWETKRGQNKVRKILQSTNCKKILPWTESVMKDVLKIYPGIKNKIEILYPAIPQIKNLNRKKKKKNLKIIFIARYFDIKGGLIALEVLDILNKEYGIEGIIVSNVPSKLKKKYPKVKIYDLMSQKKLFELMENSDLFLYPSAVDTFGFSLLEAMAFGLPTITINSIWTKSRKEIIENNKTGLIFDVNEKLLFDKITKNEKIVINKLVHSASILIKNNTLRDKMSKECIETIKEGKFSIKRRNEKLRKIYEEAIN